MRCGSFLMVANSALSTAFWSLARAEVIFFFYCFAVSAQVNSPGSSDPASAVTDLRFLALLKELFLPLLVCGLVLSKISLLSNLFDHLLIYSFQFHLRTCSNNISRIDSS